MMLLHKPRNYRCLRVARQHTRGFILCLCVLPCVVWVLFEVFFHIDDRIVRIAGTPDVNNWFIFMECHVNTY